MKRCCLVLVFFVAVCTVAYAYQEYPLGLGDLVFRDSYGSIYGRDGVGYDMAVNHCGHVGIYIGNGRIMHAIGYCEGLEEIRETAVACAPGVDSFYDREKNGIWDGIPNHNPLGAKAHRDLLNNPDAAMLRDHIVSLAHELEGCGFDTSFHTQKGPEDGDWTCCGFAEKVYESCAFQEPRYAEDVGETYGDESAYADGLNITPDGYEWHADGTAFYFQENVEFSQIPTNFFKGRWFTSGIYPRQFIFFPYTQFEQDTLIDSFEPQPTMSIQSYPDSGVYIEVTPADSDGRGNGVTPFLRTYNAGTQVTLTAAPESAGGKVFVGWDEDGHHISDVNGQITISAGDGYEYVAYYADIPPSPGDDLSISGRRWDDHYGDRDGIIEGWERVLAEIQLSSSANVSNVVATISSSESAIEFRSGTESSSYGSIADGDQRWGDDAFDMTLNKNSRSNCPFSLYVTYEKNGAPYYQSPSLSFTKDFVLQDDYGTFEVLSYDIDDSELISPRNNGDGIFQIGEDVDIRPRIRYTNPQGGEATDIDVSLIYSGDVLDVQPGSERYPDMSNGDVNYPEGGDSFDVRSCSLTYHGTMSMDVSFVWDQRDTPLVLENGLQLVIEPAAWMRLSERQWDFGVAEPGSDVTHSLSVSNVGCAPMDVTVVTTSDADTVVTPHDPLPYTLYPGDPPLDISITIHTAPDFEGQITRDIHVHSTGRTSDPAEDEHLIITGLVSTDVPVFELPVSEGEYPDVSGDWIVWHEWNQNTDIYAYQISTGTVHQITTDPAEQTGPRISGNLIVWHDLRNSDLNIYAFDMDNPGLGVFGVAASGWEQRLIGLDGNLVAFTQGYEILYDQNAQPVQVANNLLVYEYQGNGQFLQTYTTGFTPGSGHATRQSVQNDDSGDFGDGMLVFERFQWDWDSGDGDWSRGDQHVEEIDYAAGETTPTRVLDAFYSYPPYSATTHRIVYADQNVYPYRIGIWHNGGSTEFISEPDADLADYVLATGADFVVYDNHEEQDKLFYWDLDAGAKSLLTSRFHRHKDARMDGNCVVWRAKDSEDTWRILYAFIGQADMSVTPADILFSNESPVEGEALDVTVTVHNLAGEAIVEDITVQVYDGDPDDGGTQWGPSELIGGGIPGRGSDSVTFNALPAPVEGIRNIFVRVSRSGNDNPGNNKASRELQVLDSDTEGPLIYNVAVEEWDGDGDGIIGDDEQIRISWDLDDPSGISTTSLTVDGAPVARDGDYFAILPAQSEGEHAYEITATDDDTPSPESSTKTGTFDVAAAEVITIIYKGQPVVAGSEVDLGVVGQCQDASRLFIIRNDGEQALAIQDVNVSGDFTLDSSPPTTHLPPGDVTHFIVSANTATPGTLNGAVSIDNSSPVTPFPFDITITVQPCTKGDFDADGDVDASDFATFQSYYGVSEGEDGWEPKGPIGDFDDDGDVDFADFMEFVDVYETGGG